MQRWGTRVLIHIWVFSPECERIIVTCPFTDNQGHVTSDQFWPLDCEKSCVHHLWVKGFHCCVRPFSFTFTSHDKHETTYSRWWKYGTVGTMVIPDYLVIACKTASLGTHLGLQWTLQKQEINICCLRPLRI